MSKEKIIFNYGKLKERITTKYGSQDEFAKVRGHSTTAISKKLNNKNSFSNEEIMIWCNLLEIPYSEVDSYFFST